MKSNDLLNHLEKIQGDYVELVDKIPTEDKLIMAHEQESAGLAPWEISEIVQDALNGLPEELDNHVDSIFDVVYDAVASALDKNRRELWLQIF